MLQVGLQWTLQRVFLFGVQRTLQPLLRPFWIFSQWHIHCPDQPHVSLCGQPPWMVTLPNNTCVYVSQTCHMSVFISHSTRGCADCWSVCSDCWSQNRSNLQTALWVLDQQSAAHKSISLSDSDWTDEWMIRRWWMKNIVIGWGTAVQHNLVLLHASVSKLLHRQY